MKQTKPNKKKICGVKCIFPKGHGSLHYAPNHAEATEQPTALKIPKLSKNRIGRMNTLKRNMEAIAGEPLTEEDCSCCCHYQEIHFHGTGQEHLDCPHCQPTGRECSPENCPFASNSESSWGFSPEGWEQARRKHEKHSKPQQKLCCPQPYLHVGKKCPQQTSRECRCARSSDWEGGRAIDCPVHKLGFKPSEPKQDSSWEDELHDYLKAFNPHESWFKSFIENLLSQQKARLRKEYKEIFDWLRGKTDFRARKEGEGAYWWRKELRKRLDVLEELE